MDRPPHGFDPASSPGGPPGAPLPGAPPPGAPPPPSSQPPPPAGGFGPPPPSGIPGPGTGSGMSSLPPGLQAAIRRGLGIGPIIGAVASAVLLYWPSHSFGTAFGTGVTMFLVVGGLRAADPYLKPLWLRIGRVPRTFRFAAGAGLPMLFARTQFGPSAAGQEISRARQTLILSTILAYVIMRPRDTPSSGTAKAP
jgi:hypothetical protein